MSYNAEDKFTVPEDDIEIVDVGISQEVIDEAARRVDKGEDLDVVAEELALREVMHEVARG